MQYVNLADKRVGQGYPCMVVAEAGVNHNGDLNIALQLVDEAVGAGADGIKFQSFIPEELVTKGTEKAQYQKKTTSPRGGQLEMLQALALDIDQHRTIKEHCEKVGITYLCTPYELKSLDMIDSLGVAAFKVASTDTTNIPLLREFARRQRPVILSTGMCSLGEIESAVEILKGEGLDGKIILLQCTSEYPVPFADVNLRAMKTMYEAFGCPVGFSDHTEEIGASPWAVAMGACMIEKHFTLDRSMDGPDHPASIEPGELAILVETVRNVELALGDGIKRIMPSEAHNKNKMQKSLVTTRHMQEGEIFKPQDLTCKRPGTGLPPNWFDKVLGKAVRYDLPANAILPIEAVRWD